MNGKQLKNSILQWAIQGKLVPQDPNDEPASVLLEQIRAEKARLVKEKKIKKDKNESFIFRGDDNSYYEKMDEGTVKCIDDEIPFEIPSSWEWCRLSSITSFLHRGKSPKYGESKILPIIAQKCNQWDRIYTDRCLFSDKENISKYTEDQFLKTGDIIINSTGGGTVGRTGFVDEYVFETYKQFVADSHVTVVRCMDIMISTYVYYFLLSPYIQIGIEDRCSGSTNQIELGTNTIANYLIPIPPVEEQIRIVEKIKKAYPLIEHYSTSQEKLEELNIKVYKNLKKSILQEAIQGKLVPQNASEGDADILLAQIEEEKHKLLSLGKVKKKDMFSSIIFRGDDNKYYEQIGKECSLIDDNIPFEIPSSWAWSRIENIFQINPKNEREEDVMAAFIPMEKIKAGYSSSYEYESRVWGTINKNFTHFADGDVAFAKITPCFQNRKSMILKDLPNGIGAGTTELKVLRPYGGTINQWYILFFLESSYFIDEASFKGTANQQRIISGYLEHKLIPIPPLEEQERIVEKVKFLLSKIGN